MIFAIIALVIIVLIVLWAVSAYNGLVTLRNRVKNGGSARKVAHFGSWPSMER